MWANGVCGAPPALCQHLLCFTAECEFRLAALGALRQAVTEHLRGSSAPCHLWLELENGCSSLGCQICDRLASTGTGRTDTAPPYCSERDGKGKVIWGIGKKKKRSHLCHSSSPGIMVDITPPCCGEHTHTHILQNNHHCQLVKIFKRFDHRNKHKELLNNAPSRCQYFPYLTKKKITGFQVLNKNGL